MTANKYREFQDARRLALAGVPVDDACRRAGITRWTYYRHLKKNQRTAVIIEDKITKKTYLSIVMLLILALILALILSGVLR